MVILNFRSECMKLVGTYVQLNHINCIWWNCIHFSRGYSSNRDVRQHQIHQCGMGRHQLERKHFNKWWPIYRVFIRDSSSLYHTNHTKHKFFVDKTRFLSLVGLTGNDHTACHLMYRVATIMNFRLSAIIYVHRHLKNIVVQRFLIGSLRGVNIIDSFWLAVQYGFLVGSRSWGRAIVLHSVLHQYKS